MPFSVLGNDTAYQQLRVKALEREIELLKTLDHKNIVKYLGTKRDKNSLNVILEFVSGGTLENIYKKFEMDEHLCAKYTKEILEGLEYLHFNNIIHRDIKSSNILFKDDGTCQLADFGSSKKEEGNNNGSGYKSFCGTPYWMAPEVVKQ